jgi:hypothetical protein
MIAAIGAPEALSLSTWSSDGHRAASTPNVIVFDGVGATAGIPRVTVVHLRARGKAPEHPGADVTLTQALNSPNLVTVRIGRDNATVRIVATEDELHYLGSGRASWQMAAPVVGAPA